MEQKSFRDTVVEVAQSQVGLTEIPKGSNWGKHVQKYLDSVGIHFPAAWCMAFNYWCINEASKIHKQKNPLFKSGGVLNTWNMTDKSRRVKTPKPGDVFIIDFGKGLGHAGIVTSVKGNFIYTIEGNTNDDGSREGYEVAVRRRPIANIKGFINID